MRIQLHAFKGPESRHLGVKNMTIIHGKIVNKLGAANKTVPLQMPYFIEYDPFFEKCHEATINVILETPLKISKWDINTKPIPWVKNRPDITEKFSFLKISFTYKNKNYPALIYYPHQSPNRFNPFHVEILTKKLELTNDKKCSVSIDRKCRRVSIIVVD